MQVLTFIGAHDVLGSTPHILTLPVPLSDAAVAALRSALQEGVGGGTFAFTVDLDQAPVLDTQAISTLITLLRDAREEGATLRLATSRPVHHETLRITGLDRVFDIVAAPETVVPAPVAPRRRAGRRVAGILAGLIAVVSVASPIFGQTTDLTPEVVVQNISEQNASMQSFQAHVDVNIRLKTFPYIGQRLDGTTYFKRPGNFEVVFRSVPSYAKGFDRLYSDIGDPTSWHKRFDLSLVGERQFGDHKDLVVRLILRQRGMVDHEDVLVDPRKWHIDQMEWSYYNGGFIAMSQDFTQVGGYSVLAAQHATIRIPHISAMAEAAYSGYQTNVAIDEAVFTKDQPSK